jgi:RND family efflux transporter MFP subunit
MSLSNLGRRLARASLWLLLPAAVVGGVAFQKTRPVEARVVEVDTGEVRLEAIGIGTVESEAVVALSFTATGRITELALAEGQVVKVGDVIGALDLATLEKQKAVAEAGIGLANAGLAKANADLARAEATRDVAKLELARTESLVASGVMSHAALDAAKERALRSEAEAAAARAAIAQSRGAYVVARESVAVQVQQVSDGVLRSPVDGIAVKRHHEVGDVVGVGTPVYTVASTRKIWARVWVDETALARLREGAEASVRLRGDEGRPLRAKLDRVSPEADRQTHEVLVDLELVDRPERVVFGQRAEALILLEQRSAAIRAPRTACDLAAGKCWLAEGGRIAEARVAFGLSGREHVEILEGLSPGARLVDRAGFVAEPPAGKRITERAP